MGPEAALVQVRAVLGPTGRKRDETKPFFWQVQILWRSPNSPPFLRNAVLFDMTVPYTGADGA